MEQPFAFDHRAALTSFQTSGDERFVWGLDRTTDRMFFLEEDQAAAQHGHVRENVVCPVPGCASPLTTVHATTKRDHLRHLTLGGGHGLESVFHAQGCALVHAWLSKEYPHCAVNREDYINAEGERRADVLITHPSGARVAFEVQYSPLTHDAWTTRHESYRSRDVEDVWLFGHTEKQLKLDDQGRLRSNPALAAVAATGAPLLFINPTTEQLALSVSYVSSFSAKLGREILPPDVPVLGGADGSTLEVHSLNDFRLGRPTLTSERIEHLMENARELAGYNAEQRRLYAEQLERDRARQEREQVAKQAAMERTKQQREQQIVAIRAALETRAPWGESHPAAVLIGRFLANRRPRDLGPEGALEQWKCVAYFVHIAGRQNVPFGVKDVADTLYRSRIRLGQGTYKTIGRWLHELVDDGFLFEGRGGDGFPTYTSHFSGVWW
ncbi:hypothetical protein DEJ27_00045 [Curtobacterium sp. MCPF17_018]|uniref:competence protein CoiA family protein n=1 Tax=Curtobacterium sp. MCPF17_018 TaxID=2175638 RepID=UPI000DA7436F|nr:competence protein CoiA family protein [Curtobacterium sp. MCPF17_018]PZE72890.1 hypothetical protein DEJ27_00045 [Curtobacterium sp. MCPF17_018]